MNNFSDIIDAFGGYAPFSAAIGITENHAGVMKHRNSIPSVYWKRVVEAARERNIKRVSYEVLANLAEKQVAE
jgi:hypothetical protein